jgi:hypothetical protein
VRSNLTPAFFFLIATALPGPAPATALECDNDWADSPISGGVWHYEKPLGGDRAALVQVAAVGSEERGFDVHRLGQSGRIVERKPVRAPRVGDESAAWTDREARLNSPRSLSGTPSASSDEDKVPGLSATHFPPEPGSWAMLIAGLLGIWRVARRRIFSI